MTSSSESDTSSSQQSSDTQPSGWIKVGVIAAASALAGGLAAAWWYRKTLKTFRQTGETTINPHFGIPAERTGDDD
jgi:hypothetical protein